MTRRFQLYLPDPVLTRLELEAHRTGRSKADIIREALERFFAQGASPGKALASIVGLAGPQGTRGSGGSA
ncbi:MAG: CopG family transcriptional regulator [Candidatus Wallbacteria bacterium]|nr:CopG family transcriptional regulator [Candidatus Wallbacteria bacterium]MBI4867838.1 CopG family transcriptional regulator [Candidatus Wallbacteria bacterium]